MGSPENKRLSYGLQIEEEAKTWCIEDPEKRAEKMQRERIRHPKIIRDLLLDKLDTSNMLIVEIGGGPEPISDLLDYRTRIVIDPCTLEYAEYFPVPDHVNGYAEGVLGDDLHESTVDLVIATNSLDHVRDHRVVIGNVYKALKPGGYFAVMCAENNAITNPHPCHTINLDAKEIHRLCDQWCETVWELTYEKDRYRYGWAEYQGKIGQPAFALLMRKVVGY